MTTPGPVTDAERAARIQQDGEDRRFAAAMSLRFPDPFGEWTKHADEIYAWLRERASTAPSSLTVTPGTPQPEGTPQ